jgi:fused signal recognition particle receptor
VAPLLVVAVALVIVIVLVVVVFTRRGGGSTTSTPTRDAPAPARRAPAGSAGGFGPSGLGARVRAAFGTEADGDRWAALEDVLLRADVGPRATADLLERLRARGGGDPVDLLRDEIIAVLGPERPVDLDAPGLDVILVVGVNGSGKTTTIGKLAARLVGEGKRVSLAAADTFRAAAGEQLEVWAKRSGAQLVSQDR